MEESNFTSLIPSEQITQILECRTNNLDCSLLLERFCDIYDPRKNTLSTDLVFQVANALDNLYLWTLFINSEGLKVPAGHFTKLLRIYLMMSMCKKFEINNKNHFK